MKQSIETDINRNNNIYISYANYVLILHACNSFSYLSILLYILVTIYMCISINELMLLYLSF